MNSNSLVIILQMIIMSQYYIHFASLEMNVLLIYSFFGLKSVLRENYVKLSELQNVLILVFRGKTNVGMNFNFGPPPFGASVRRSSGRRSGG